MQIKIKNNVGISATFTDPIKFKSSVITLFLKILHGFILGSEVYWIAKQTLFITVINKCDLKPAVVCIVQMQDRKMRSSFHYIINTESKVLTYLKVSKICEWIFIWSSGSIAPSVD